MKNFKIITIVLVSLISFGCKTEEMSLKPLDEIQATKYYSSDIIPAQSQLIYGIWKVDKTSGGFSETGYTKDFDYLLLKANGIFGIMRNDSLIAYGKLSLLTDMRMSPIYRLFCKFDFDKMAKIELYGDSEKYFHLLGNDSLDLIAPCCDRYNTHLIREKSDLKNKGMLRGKISIGPLCPVETNPLFPGCLPTAETYKAYQTSV